MLIHCTPHAAPATPNQRSSAPKFWPHRWAWLPMGLALSACTSVDLDASLRQASAHTAHFSSVPLTLARDSAAQTERRAAANAVLQAPLSQSAAVQLALLNSPAVQALLARHWAVLADAAESGRPLNPLLSLERNRMGSELEFNRLISVGLVDLLSWPARAQAAERRQTQASLQLAADVVRQVSTVRQAWVQAVAARQLQAQAQRVVQSAEAGAELARRMVVAGHFSKLDLARQLSFEAEARSQQDAATLTVQRSREALVRQLGLSAAQTEALQLPDRLPPLPSTLPDAPPPAWEQRIDVQLARAELDAARRAQGLGGVGSLLDAEIGLRRDSVHDTASGTNSPRRGAALNLRLPWLNPGDAARAGLQARTLAAEQSWEATLRNAHSQFREAARTLQASHQIALRQRNEWLPLHQTIAEENLLRYNGMLTSVFELLADAREQARAVATTLAAEQQYWLADAAWQAELIGQPMLQSTLPAGAEAGSSPSKDTP